MGVLVNFKEVEKNIKKMFAEKLNVGRIKKELPKVTKEFCDEWYRKYPKMKNIISKNDLIKTINKSSKIYKHNNEKVEITVNLVSIEEREFERNKQMNKLWNEFKRNFIDYVMKKLFN